MNIKALFSDQPNKEYQRVARAERSYIAKGKMIPADILLKAQQLNDTFMAHHYNPSLFAPTPAQRVLADTLLSTNSVTNPATLRLAVLEYLMITAPDSLK